jgi:hypothetical protein
MLGSYGASASWAGVVYENRYVLEDGVWKINELSYSSQYSGRYNPPGVTVSKWDLPYHYTAQSAGAPLPKSALFPERNAGSAANFEDLQKRWVNVARRAQQLRDETDVLNLQHAYGYFLDRKMLGDAANLFTNDGTLESGLRGVYAGRNRVRRALEVIHGPRLSNGEVNDHLQLATVVHIAPDGRTAKARGIELSVSGVRGNGAQWEEGIFENQYVKQDGAWRIRSVHYYPRVITDYELGWAKDAKSAPEASREFSPDFPPTEDYGIYPKMYYPRFHYPNPVTQAPVQYPLPTATAMQPVNSGPGSSSIPPLQRLPGNMKELAQQLTVLETQVQTSIAYDAIENLVNAHGYYLDDSRTDELQRLFNGIVDLRSLSTVDMGPAIHQTVQPLIEVAADGESATLRARLLSVGGKAGEFVSGTYDGRATSIDGSWKLRNLELRQSWSSPFARWTPVIGQRR